MARKKKLEFILDLASPIILHRDCSLTVDASLPRLRYCKGRHHVSWSKTLQRFKLNGSVTDEGESLRYNLKRPLYSVTHLDFWHQSPDFHPSPVSRLIIQAPTAAAFPQKLRLIDSEGEEGNFRVFLYKSLSGRDVQPVFGCYSILIVPGAKDAYEQMFGNPWAAPKLLTHVLPQSISIYSGCVWTTMQHLSVLRVLADGWLSNCSGNPFTADIFHKLHSSILFILWEAGKPVACTKMLAETSKQPLTVYTQLSEMMHCIPCCPIF